MDWFPSPRRALAAAAAAMTLACAGPAASATSIVTVDPDLSTQVSVSGPTVAAAERLTNPPRGQVDDGAFWMRPVGPGDGRSGTSWAAPTDGRGNVVIPRNRPEVGLVYTGLRAGSAKACANHLVVQATGACTHGPDPLPQGYSMTREVKPLTDAQARAEVARATAASGVTASTGSAGASAVTGNPAMCFGDGSEGNRVQVLYVYSGTNRYAEYADSFRTWAIGMDRIYNDSAKKTGGTRHIRFVHDSNCVPTVTPVQLSSSALNDFSSTISALKSAGYNRSDRKYTLFGDANVYCGIGEFDGDTRKSSQNYSNFGPSFARTDSNCWGPSVIAHELGHNLGAVNNNAPNASGGAHCTDEYDVMCYSDSPYYPQMRYVCDQSQADLLDCGNNDYYSTNPPAGSYLANYWNMADSVFLARADGGANPTPTPTPTPTATTSPSPTPSPTSTTPPPPACTGSTFSGYLSGSGQGAVEPDGSYYSLSRAGTLTGCLTGEGADFELYLQRWDGYRWQYVASSTGSSSTEKITYAASSGYYRWYVYSYSGSGNYSLVASVG